MNDKRRVSHVVQWRRLSYLNGGQVLHICVEQRVDLLDLDHRFERETFQQTCTVGTHLERGKSTESSALHNGVVTTSLDRLISAHGHIK